MNLKNVATGTWVRIITLFLVLINLISVSIFNFNLLPFEEESISEGVSIALTIVVTIWTTWKNNAFTKKAQMADQYLERIKEK